MKQIFSQVFALFLVLVLFAQISYAQDNKNKWSVDISLIKNEYRGDLMNGFFKFGENAFWGGGVGVNRYLSPFVDGSLQTSFGSYGANTGIPALSFLGTRLDASLQLRFKFNNGAILPVDSRFSPFVSAGVGVGVLSGTDIGTGTPLYIPLGVGLKYAISNVISLQYLFSFNLTSDDKADKKLDIPTPKGDNFIKHSLGIVINFGKIEGSNKCGCSKGYYRH